MLVHGKATGFAGPRRGGVRMSGRIVRAISWVVVPLVVVLTLGQIYLSALNRAGDAPGAAGIVVSTLPDLLALGWLALGLLVAHRRPANPVGYHRWHRCDGGDIGLR